jgi:hypothetical protein
MALLTEWPNTFSWQVMLRILQEALLLVVVMRDRLLTIVSDKLKRLLQNSRMPPACPGEALRWLLPEATQTFTDATALRGGGSRLVLFTQAISGSL